MLEEQKVANMVSTYKKASKKASGKKITNNGDQASSFAALVENVAKSNRMNENSP